MLFPLNCQHTNAVPYAKKQAGKCPYSYSLIRSKHFTKILLSTNHANTILSTMPIAADTSTHWVPIFNDVPPLPAGTSTASYNQLQK